jgi:hypothetical protein
MIEFKGDERFADVEFVGMSYEPVRRVLTLLVSSDPADNCKTVLLRDVAAFDVIHFTRQNVVHYLDIARLAAIEHQAFVDLARKEGASITLAADPDRDTLLGSVFVPANGATIFALCRSIEKCSKDGQSLYIITT